jgi:hypothetical protein
MKKPLRLFAFVFFLFAIYLNLFYKEDSFLARLTSGKNSKNNSQTTTSSQPALSNSSEDKLAEVKEK